MHKEFFDQITSALKEMGYPALDSPLVEAQDVFQLTVSLPQAPPLQIVGFFLNDLLRLASADTDLPVMEESGMESSTDFLQLFIRFPFDFSEQTTSDLARLLLMINWTTPVGAFGINEPQKIIYYRQVFEWQNNQEQPGLVLDAVSAMEFYASLRFERIRAMASGEQTMAGLLLELDRNNTRNEEFPGYDL